MKRFILLLTVACFGYGAKAQYTKISIAANVGAPTNSQYKISYGADLQADLWVAPELALTASGGFQDYHWKVGTTPHDKGLIPLLGGAKFNLGQSQAYGHAQLGYAVSTEKHGTGAFAYAASIGYNFSRHFDGAVKYLASSKNSKTLGSFNLRLAYIL